MSGLASSGACAHRDDRLHTLAKLRELLHAGHRLFDFHACRDDVPRRRRRLDELSTERWQELQVRAHPLCAHPQLRDAIVRASDAGRGLRVSKWLARAPDGAALPEQAVACLRLICERERRFSELVEAWRALRPLHASGRRAATLEERAQQVALALGALEPLRLVFLLEAPQMR